MKFWGRASASDAGRRAYAELYTTVGGREAVAIHVEGFDGEWSVVRLPRADFEALVSAWRASSRDQAG